MFADQVLIGNSVARRQLRRCLSLGDIAISPVVERWMASKGNTVMTKARQALQETDRLEDKVLQMQIHATEHQAAMQWAVKREIEDIIETAYAEVEIRVEEMHKQEVVTGAITLIANLTAHIP